MDWHKPVLINKIIENINIDAIKGEIYILDACFGEGGYSKILLEKFPNIKIIGIEQDEEVFSIAQKNMKIYEDRVFLFNDNFVKIPEILNKLDLNFVSFSIFDLGISMYHIKESKKGITFLEDQILDMRLSKYAKIPAYEIINKFTEKELSDIFYKYGEERYSRKIAHFIVEERKKIKIMKTSQLENIVKKAVGFKRNYKINPATRVFQALRIYVNNELENLEKVLSFIPDRTILKGRIFILSYHSLEDRIVKKKFLDLEKEGYFVKVFKKPILADSEEIKLNPSSRSAKLRIYEKIKMLQGINYENH
ncbi:MAG: 16S rRNA (cytosine(1402)-N(4))-methyltransferase RsmH [Spirochaetes bacterium]|nr:16S rRNA (cytosine(1402)-N(4))-methyltransferase RsmH [Spirochaetota bacterium]